MPSFTCKPGKAARFWQFIMGWRPEQHSPWLRYGLAIVLTLAAGWLRIWLAPAETGGRFLTFTLAGALAALMGGFGPGMLSTVIGVVMVNYFMVKPYGQFAFKDPVNAMILNGWHLTTQLLVVGSIWLLQERHRQLIAANGDLETARRNFQDSFEHAAAGISHVDIDGHLIQVNQTFCDMVGYSADELKSMRFQDFTLPEDIGPDERFLKETLSGLRQSYSLQKRYVHKEGRTVWAQLTVSLMRDKDGHPDHFISVVQDLTPYKETEERLRTSERLMRQAQALVKMTTWEGDVAIGRYKAHNQSHVWLGLPSDQFTNADLVRMAYPGEQERLISNWRKSVVGKVPYDATYRAIVDGKETWFSVRAEFERDENGVAVKAYGVTQDITERVLAQQQIRDLNKSLERRIRDRTHQLQLAYKQLESYAYAVAHDLRSPLRIINGFAQAITDDDPQLSPASKIHLDRIKNASRKMGMMIDGLLVMSQYDRGEVHRAPVNLSAVATRLLEERSMAQPDRHLRWQVEPGMVVQADPSLLDPLLQNLLDNAWKYTTAQPDAKIKVFSRQHQGRTFICVQDNGAGFDMARAAKLFQPFQRLHTEAEFEGLGIGLATVRRIIERHGGDTKVESAPGKGTVICFTLEPAKLP